MNDQYYVTPAVTRGLRCGGRKTARIKPPLMINKGYQVIILTFYTMYKNRDPVSQ